MYWLLLIVICIFKSLLSFYFHFLLLKKKPFSILLQCALGLLADLISAPDAVRKRTLRKICGKKKKRCFKSHQTVSIRLSLVSSLSVQQEYIFYESNLETIMCFLFIGEFFQLKGGEGSGNSGVFRRMSGLKPQGDELKIAIQNQWSDTEGQWQERKMNSWVSQYREKGENKKSAEISSRNMSPTCPADCG